MLTDHLSDPYVQPEFCNVCTYSLRTYYTGICRDNVTIILIYTTLGRQPRFRLPPIV